MERLRRVRKKALVFLCAAAGRAGKDLYDFRYGLALFALYYLFVHLVFHAFCPMVILTGLPCPGCGMTRAFLFLLTGQWERSFHANPLAPFVLFLLLYCSWFRYGLGRKIKGFYPLLTALCIAMITVYILRMLTEFPGRPPYSYTPGNLLAQWIPGYREVVYRIFS